MAVRLAIALAFADASVAVLALPQIVVRLHTTISHVAWVITAYNLALIAGTLAVLPVARALASRRALVAGLAIFGLASLGSGAAGSLTVLIIWRCLQGAGGALLL
ncbi:MAG: MFS transporter, partial [Actinomycetota bacterium]|nr:MFS transporter [Actinomycetota bacterium]